MAHPITPIPDLQRFYGELAADAGLSGIAYSDAPRGTQQLDALAAAIEPGWCSPPTPSRARERAGGEQRRILAVLAELTVGQRAVLDLAYTPRHPTQHRDQGRRELAVRHGADHAAVVLASRERRRREGWRQLVGRLGVPDGEALWCGVAAVVWQRGAEADHAVDEAEVTLATEHAWGDDLARWTTEGVDLARWWVKGGQVGGCWATGTTFRRFTPFDHHDAEWRLHAARTALRLAKEAAERAEPLAVDELRTAHDAYRAAADVQRANARHELAERRAAGRARSAALLAELLAPGEEQRRARAEAWLEELRERSGR